MRAFAKILLLLLWAATSSAQKTLQYSFKHFSVENGLVSNSVRQVLQDKDGYIWLATVNGLQRYDGSTFLTFKSHSTDKTTIPSNMLGYMYLDKANNLWVMGDNDRAGIFDTRTFTFHEVPIQGQENKLWLSQGFFELASGELMLLKSSGVLLQYRPKENRFTVSDKIPAPAGWKRNRIVWDPSVKRYWMSCDSGLAQYNPSNGRLNYRGHNIDNDAVIRAFESTIMPFNMFVDAGGNVSFTYWRPYFAFPTIYRYNRKLGKAESFVTGIGGYHEIYGFMQQRNGRRWVYGMPFLAEWREQSDSSAFVMIPNDRRHNQIVEFDYPYQVAEDKENNLWVGTDNGVYLFNPDAQVFNTYNITLPDNTPSYEGVVQAMEETKEGNIFVGCWGSRLTYYDKDLNPLPLPDSIPPGEHSIWDMATNPKTGDIWMTFQAGSIVIYDKNKKFRRIAPPVFEGRTILQVDEDTSGNLWFGTHDGKLVKWDYIKSGGDPTKGYEVIMRTGMVIKVHYDYKGFIWIGVLDYGLMKIDVRTNKVVKVFTSRGSPGQRIFSDRPTDMTYYDDSTLIVAAGCINIVNTRTNKIRFITAEDGLPSNTVESVEKDDNGILWIGMTNGLCRLNLAKNLITYYDKRDGIAYDKFGANGIKELKDGRLVYFTDHNFLIFDPKRFGQEYIPPKANITSFKLAGTYLSLDSIQKESRAVLKYNNTSITIGFSALSYLQQQKVHYYYMLENLDKDWIRVDRPEQIIYNYLPPGNYVFKVKSENADGITNPEIATLNIIVRPPVWNTWWFYSLIALLAIAVLYLLDQERMKRAKSLSQMRNQIRLSLRDEVSTTLNNINVLSEIAKIKTDKNIDQAKDFIDQISDKSRHMIEAMDDTLWSIDPKNDSMKQTVLRIKELTEGLRLANGVEIDLIVDNKVQSMELDMKLRYELFFFYKEAISFIIQQTGCSQAFVNINKLRSKLLLEILAECEDSTAGMEAKFRTAMEKRLRNLPATFDIVSDSKSFSIMLHVEVKS